ncbi:MULTISPECIES: hypothetical protein [Rhodococcus]|uniref:hypothetical protein n=1 Tax=Rhodococcus TaxID=1827 RepID=UPI001BE6FE7D|nr:hypothetical protein [Rhodococcus erythropolis]MBT2264631.1 hypothetical protein [Rhodococcus erythropolis]
MTLTELLSSIGKESQVKRLLATLFFLEVVESSYPVSSATAKNAILSARVPGAKNWNVPTLFTKAAANVEYKGDDDNGRKLWQLTSSGRKLVTSFVDTSQLQTASAKHREKSDVEQIRATIEGIQNSDAKEYAGEAVDCLSVGCRRAAIVFMWVAATHEIQDRVWNSSTPQNITAAAQKHNPKAKGAKKRDDLVEYNEALLLQVAQDLGVIDKNEKSELSKCLDLRNACGHPNKYRPGEHKTKAHIEDIVTILFK